MKNEKKINLIREDTLKKLDLPVGYSKANFEFQRMMRNIPDFSKMEPIEIYNWVEKLTKLTKI